MAAVLLVDDDAMVLETVGNMLEAAGHAVHRAQSGSAALDILDADKPVDLLLTDVVMPGLHGFNLARMARIRRPNLRVIYFSGFHELPIAERDRGERLGKLLSKPIRFEELNQEIVAAMQG